MFVLTDFRVGDRIELHPATDLWMRGARFGLVCKIGRVSVALMLDGFRRPIRVAPENIYRIVDRTAPYDFASKDSVASDTNRH